LAVRRSLNTGPPRVDLLGERGVAVVPGALQLLDQPIGQGAVGRDDVLVLAPVRLAPVVQVQPRGQQAFPP